MDPTTVIVWTGVQVSPSREASIEMASLVADSIALRWRKPR
jgi:hypothetical protein